MAQRLPHARFRVSSVNGRIMLGGTAPDAKDGSTGDDHRQAVRRRRDQLDEGQRAPQQVMLEGVSSRCSARGTRAGRERQVEKSASTEARCRRRGWNRLLISGAVPFGSVVGRMLSKWRKGRRADRCPGGTRRRRRLAEPNLDRTSEIPRASWRAASSRSRSRRTLGTVTIEFKKFGVGLAFTPTVLGDGLINLKIEPEVSQIDPTTVIRANGITIPSLIVRRANTTVELRDGQSFAIAGLLQSISQTDQKQLPWLGDVPVLGALARSAAYQKKEIDLVIIVTPRLVRPARPGDVLRTPLDTSKPANDPEFFLLGQSEITVPMERRLKVTGRPGPASRPHPRRSQGRAPCLEITHLHPGARGDDAHRRLHRHVSRPAATRAGAAMRSR